MTYLDNAATSYPKPQEVFNAIKNSMCLCSNPGRGGHLMSRRSATLVYKTRESIAKLFCFDFPENVIFTQNATQALNFAIKGLVKSGEHILISDIEHNSVVRAVEAVKRQGCSYSVYKSFGSAEDIIKDISSKLTPKTRMIVACHRSNICGRTLPIEKIGAFARSRNIRFVVDASQSAGSVPINFEKSGADVICAPGHKGLFSIMGCGFMIVSPRVKASDFNTLIEGGSGMNSLEKTMPDVFPERLEGGTLPFNAVCTLGAGAEFVMSQGAEAIGQRENMLMKRACEMLSTLKNVTIHDRKENKGSVLLFSLDNLDCERAGQLLDTKGIYLRTGLHCAPLAHQSIIGNDKGACRASFGYFNTPIDCERLYKEVSRIALCR